MWGSFWNCKLFSVATTSAAKLFEILYNTHRKEKTTIIATTSFWHTIFCIVCQLTMGELSRPQWTTFARLIPVFPPYLLLSLPILSWLNSENIIFALSIVFFILLFHWSRTNLVKNKSRRGFSPAPAPARHRTVLESQVIADKLRIYKMLANIFRLDKGRAKVLRQALLSRKLFAHNFWLGLN